MSKPYRGKAAEQGPNLPAATVAADHAALTGVSPRAYIRLEVLRLAYRPDAAPDAIVKRAQALEAYVCDDQPADKF